MRPSATFQGFAASYLQTVPSVFSEKDFGYTNGLTNIPSKASLDLMDQDLQKLQLLLKSKNIKFVTVFLPTKHYAATHGWAEAKAFHKVEALLKKHKITYYQFLDKFHEQEDPASYFLDYVHLNEKGHQFVSDEVLSLKLFALKTK